MPLLYYDRHAKKFRKGALPHLTKLVLNERTGEWSEKAVGGSGFKVAAIGVLLFLANAGIWILNALWAVIAWVFTALWSVIVFIFTFIWEMIKGFFQVIWALIVGVVGCALELLMYAAIIGFIIWILTLIF